MTTDQQQGSDAWVVVMEAKVRPARRLWAWCRVAPGLTGFEQIDYTETDGVTPVTDLDVPPELVREIFTLYGGVT